MVAADLDPTVDFAAGTAAGVVGLLVAHPFDTVKTRFQNPAVYAKYTSTLHAFATIVREERFTGLYKGIASPLATCAFMNGVVFSSYKVFMRAQLDDAGSEPSLAQVGVAGAGCGMVASLIASPTELIKIRQQNVLASEPASAARVAMGVVRRHGLRGLYRGLTATALRDTGYGTYFLTYEAACRHLKGETEQLGWGAQCVAGGVAGLAGWAATFPMDVVKTRMQSTEEKGRYRTVLSTATDSYRAEGARVFVRGLAPTLVRSVPVNAATFAVYEAVVRTLR